MVLANQFADAVNRILCMMYVDEEKSVLASELLLPCPILIWSTFQRVLRSFRRNRGSLSGRSNRCHGALWSFFNTTWQHPSISSFLQFPRIKPSIYQHFSLPNHVRLFREVAATKILSVSYWAEAWKSILNRKGRQLSTW
jgi:hypothetical protein